MEQPISLKTKIITPRVDETRDWYRDLIGMEVAEEWNEAGDRGCILSMPASRGEAYLEIFDGPDHDFAGLSLQFRVRDVDDYSGLDDQRFESRGPEDRPWGSRYLFLTDPNGIAVILFSGSSL